MKIDKRANATSLEIALEGRLDTTTAPQLDKELRSSLNGVTELILDFGRLEYISSAGLRVLLFAQKTMSRQGSIRVTHVSEVVREVFDLTGFSEILNIK